MSVMKHKKDKHKQRNEYQLMRVKKLGQNGPKKRVKIVSNDSKALVFSGLGFSLPTLVFYPEHILGYQKATRYRRSHRL